MKDKIQYEKAENKLYIIERLFIDLIAYNNINNFNDKFNLKMNYFYDSLENCYRYTFKLYRGTNKVNNILELNIKYKEKINDLLEKMIEKIINNDNFLYFSQSANYNKNITGFSINMKENISFDFEIKDDEDKEFYDNIRNNHNITTIIITAEKADSKEEEKDTLLELKALKTIEIIKNIINSLNDYNKLENYDNNKQFKLVVNKKEEDGYSKFNFKIVRGNIEKDIIIDLSLSIKDYVLIYNELYELMLEYISKEDFIYNTISNFSYNKSFNIHLKNNIILSFNINDIKDELFYNNFFIEYKRELIERKMIKQKELNK